MLGVVIQIDAREAVTGNLVALRAGSHDHPAVCHLSGAVAWPTIAKLPKLGYDLFDGAFEGRIATPSASMSIGIEPWPSFARLAIADSRFRLWTGDVGTPFGGWTQRVDALVTQQPAIADGQAELTFAVDDRWLDRALLATYDGTTGAEGPSALKGQAKPLALGTPRYVPGVLVDAANSLFQISGYGPIVAVDAALERLLRYGPPTQDFPNVAALLTAQIPAGRWATALSGGWARFGAPPTGQVSFLVRGDANGPDGWSRRPGQLIRRLAHLSGGAGRIADASLNALDAARPYNLSLYLDQQTTARELIQEIAASVNAVAGVSWMGRLFVQPVAIGASTVTLAADGSALPPVGKVRQLEIDPPFGKLAITAERTWSVHALGDIAFTATLVDMGAYVAGTTYREGNIVQLQGSSWLYVNPVPSAGNSPPQLPVTGNAYWRVLAKAGENGKDGLDGKNGLDGKDGLNGANGQSIHIAFADSADGRVNFTTGVGGSRTYIGVYTDLNPGADSDNPDSYGWTLIKGADGKQGLPGPGGYVHLAYASSPDGTANFHLSDPTGRTYIGVYTDQLAPDSENPAAYSWSLIKGADGSNGADGFSIAAIAPFLIPVFPNGSAKTTWTGGSGVIRLYKGNGEITAGVTYSLEGAANMVGLALNGQTFSFASIAADAGYFTIVAAFNGVSYRSRVEAKKAYDGSAAFRANAQIPQSRGADFSGTGSTAVPGGTTVRVYANLTYSAPDPNGEYTEFTGRMVLYYRNVSANGPLTALGQVDGSRAYTRNNGTAAEPNYEFVSGYVSAAFDFAAPGEDTIFEYSTRIVPVVANGAIVSAGGAVGLSTVG